MNVSKVGRNDPCPCGSGQKYKKCCWSNDVAISDVVKEDQIAKLELAKEPWEMDNEPEFPDVYSSVNEEDTDDTKSGPSHFSDDDLIGLPFPETSEEDEAFINKWFDDFKQLDSKKNYSGMIRLMEQFIAENEHLVPAWGIEGDWLIELVADCSTSGLTDEIIIFLEQFRRQFPDIYLREFAYYDNYIIFHKILTNKFGEIPEYLNFYIEYPDKHPDEYFSLVDHFRYYGLNDMMLPFVNATFERIIDSGKVFGGINIIEPLVLEYHAEYMKPGATHADFELLCNKLKNAPVGKYVDDELLKPEYWVTIHQLYFTKFRLEKFNPGNKKDAGNFYRQMLASFNQYCHDHVVQNWHVVSYMSERVSEYYSYIISKQLAKKNNIFLLEKDYLDKFISYRFKDMLWVDSLKTNAFLTGMTHLVRFLVVEGIVDSAEIEKIDIACKELHQTTQEINGREFSRLLTAKFPMY